MFWLGLRFAFGCCGYGLGHVVLGLSPWVAWFGLDAMGFWGALVLGWADWFGLGLLWTDADVSGWSMFLDWAGLA